MRWISSEGGPLLLLPESLLGSWNGIRQTPDKGLADYDRACQIRNYVGIIPVGNGEGLVLGEHMQTGWVPGMDNITGMLVQWSYAENEDSVVCHLKEVHSKIFESTGLMFRVPPGKLLLFDSASPGTYLAGNDILLVELKEGDYRIETGTFRPDESTALVIHRLTYS